jgi:hypothetical protein
MRIQVIGAGCAACKQMEADVRAVAARLGILKNAMSAQSAVPGAVGRALLVLTCD